MPEQNVEHFSTCDGEWPCSCVTRELGGGVAESNAPVAPGEVQESRPAAPAENAASACEARC